MAVCSEAGTGIPVIDIAPLASGDAAAAKAAGGALCHAFEMVEFAYVNSRLAEMHGVKVEGLIGGDTVNVFADPTSRARMLEQFGRDGRVRDLELLLRRADGSTYWALISIEPIQFEGKNGRIAWAYDITERKQAEQAQRELLESSPVGVSIHSFDGESLFANQAFADMLGCTLAAAKEFNAADIYTDRNMRTRVLDAMKRGERLDGVESEQQRQDGSTARVLLHFQPLDYGGQQALIAWHYDLTERLEAEQALRESEDRLSTILEASPIGVSIIDGNGVRIWANSRLAEMYGQSVEKLVAQDTVEVFTDPAARARLRDEFDQHGLVRDMEMEMSRVDGTEFLALISMEPTEFGGENARIAWVYDIEERRQAEQALRESEDRLSRILEVSPLGLSILETGTNVRLWANSRLAEMYGSTVDDLLGHDSSSVYPDLREREKLLQRFQEGADVRNTEVLLRRMDGTPFWALVTFEPIEFEGKPARISWVYDITERKNAEQEIAEKSAILEEVMESIDQGISMFDQDLNGLAYNSRFLDLLEFPADSFSTNDPFEKFIRYNVEREEYGPGDVEEQVRDNVEAARRFEPHQFERTRPNGTVLEIRGRPTASGGIVTTYTDITARRQAEQLIRESEDRLSTILEASPIGRLRRSRGRRDPARHPRARGNVGQVRAGICRQRCCGAVLRS